MIVGMLLFSMVPAPSRGEPIHPLAGSSLYGAKKELVRRPGQTSHTWQFRFEIPEDAQLENTYWTRMFRTTGRLTVVEEAFGRDAYFVRVRLLGTTSELRQGTLNVWLQRSERKPPQRRPAAPQLCFVDCPCEPEFEWEKPCETLALSLYDRLSGDFLWQGVLNKAQPIKLSEKALQVGGRYLLIASQGDSWGRYSMPTNLAFRIDQTTEVCPLCKGDGVAWGDRDDSLPSEKPPVCPGCQGHGHVLKDKFVQERL